MDYKRLAKTLHLDEDFLRTMDETMIADIHCLIGKLRMRFDKLPKQEHEYYLSYSGGKDSHLLYWYIKEFMPNADIPIVAVNTYREHREISQRMNKYADIVLYPTMSMSEINEEYGMPCFSKHQDEMIRRYQSGCRSEYLLNIVNGTTPTRTGRKSSFNLNNTARTLLLGGGLHKCSAKCCDYTKKKPLHLYEKKTKKKPIIAVRGAESDRRKANYGACLNTKGVFTPLFDFTTQSVELLYNVYHIEIPNIYQTIPRTGCCACPYGKNILEELKQCTANQIKYAIDSFDKSYKVKGIYEEAMEIYEAVKAEEKAKRGL